MNGYTIEIVRGWRVVSGPGGRILGVHRTDAKARAQIAAIANKVNAPSIPRRSVK